MFDVKHIEEDEGNLLVIFNEFPEHVYRYRFYSDHHPIPFEWHQQDPYDPDPSYASSEEHFPTISHAGRVLPRITEPFKDMEEGDDSVILDSLP